MPNPRNTHDMNKPLSDLSSRLETARAAVEIASAATLARFCDPGLAVDLKADQSPVTEADRAAEAILRERLLDAFPHDGFLGEESGSASGTSGYEWIVDPIDGTKSFIRGVPLYATLVGCRLEGRGVLGVIAIPALRETVYATLGGGAWHLPAGHPPGAEPAAARVSNRPLADALWCTSATTAFAERGSDAARERLNAACRLARTWGDGYGYLLVATGRAEIMVDPIMNAWDAAAVEPVIHEAGGRFSDWKGRSLIDSGDGLATNGGLHDEVLLLLAATPDNAT
jgi:histidinol-phosphatase